MFLSLDTCPVECRLLAALLRRIPQGENLEFICNLVLGICYLKNWCLEFVIS